MLRKSMVISTLLGIFSMTAAEASSGALREMPCIFSRSLFTSSSSLIQPTFYSTRVFGERSLQRSFHSSPYPKSSVKSLRDVSYTFQEDKVAKKIAREILMVDDNNQSLIPGYEKIIDRGIDKLNPSATNKDVLVLGAGISGLLTGKLLQDAGFNVTILEANVNRVGGRIKTFHPAQGKAPPFSDPKLYAEAGAMRIPTSHPLVNRLIEKFQLKTQNFYNVDVQKDNPEKHAGSSWVCANEGKYWRYWNEYNEGRKRSDNDLPGDTPSGDRLLGYERTLGFTLPAKYYEPDLYYRKNEYKNVTAQFLFDDALHKAGLKDEQLFKTPVTDAQVDAWSEILKKYDKYSMFNFLEYYYPDRVVIDYIGTIQNLTSRLHLSFIHSFVDTFYINSGTKYLEISGGNYKLPYKLADSLKSNTIVMNGRAVEIQWSSPDTPISAENKNLKAVHREHEGVYVRTIGERVDEDNGSTVQSMDREFTADYLVVSLPFSSLRILDVCPQFSYSKHRAVTELHYDSATKILLEFSERFWEWGKEEWSQWLSGPYKGHGSIGGGSATDSPNRFIYYPSNSPEGSRGGVILASYTWSDEASRWDSILPDDRIAYALRGLTDIYGKNILRFYTGRYQTQSWMMNYYSFGEAAVFTPGQILGLYPNTSTPEGPIHFVGEHTSMKHAWIEGAIESAIRAALEIRSKFQPPAS